ncbi:hypothetical protein DSO57_1016627 [Entomophthora muscae]|uniref:Uncharacterized protein n=1 Tax=Entomophthora muscae TaxID=34485 RepID=A0ACC2T4S9_9FUNG|nr:hypothetical protein DSO57_1016627 [Entomophthora muscae]
MSSCKLQPLQGNAHPLFSVGLSRSSQDGKNTDARAWLTPEDPVMFLTMVQVLITLLRPLCSQYSLKPYSPKLALYMLIPKTSKTQICNIGAHSNMYPDRYTDPAGHPHCGTVSALGENGSLPEFCFGEDVLSFLDKLETFTVGDTEEQKIKYLLGSLCQNSFDNILPSLGLVYSYWYLQSVIRHKLFYPQSQSNPRSRQNYGNNFLHSCNHQTDILKTSQAAPCPTLLSLPEDNSGSVQSGREITLLPEVQ